MKTKLALAVLCPAMAYSAPSAAFFAALHKVETGSRTGAIIGDSGAALGPLQIHRGYWQDAHVSGEYRQCADLAYSKRVVSAYLKRFAPTAWQANDVQVLSRIHNGGPHGASKQATLKYWQRIRAALAAIKS